MRGSTIKYTPARGKPTFGYTFFAGRDENGKCIQKVKRGFETKTEAEEALRKAIEERQGVPAVLDPSTRTLNQLYEEWMEKRVRRECTPRTAQAYQEQAGYALRRLGTLELRQLTRNRIEDTIHEIADRGGQKTEQFPNGRPLSKKTIRGIGFVLRGCLSFGVYRDYIPKHPMDGLKLPKLETGRKPKIVESDEFEKVLQVAAGTRLFSARGFG